MKTKLALLVLVSINLAACTATSNRNNRLKNEFCTSIKIDTIESMSQHQAAITLNAKEYANKNNLQFLYIDDVPTRRAETSANTASLNIGLSSTTSSVSISNEVRNCNMAYYAEK